MDENILYFELQHAGLCNQLYCFISAILEGIFAKKSVCIKGFYVDLAFKDMISVDALLDIDKINKVLVEHNTKIIVNNSDNKNQFAIAPLHPHDPFKKVLRPTLLKQLVFAENILEISKQLCGELPYYCVHFRLEVDTLLHYRERYLYQKILDLIAAEQNSEARTIVDQFVSRQRPWIEAQVDHYVNAVKIVCKNLEYPIYTLCAIGKPVLGRINDAVEWTFNDFCTKLSPRKIVRCNQFSAPGREYAAAVELNIACNDNCAGFIATNGSTFSATVFQRISIDKQLYTLTFSEIEMPIYV